MTAAGRSGMAAADAAVLEAIGRRLAAIDDELPRLRPWRADREAAGQLHVVRGRVRRAGAAGRSRDVGDARLRPARNRAELAGAAVAAVLVVALLATTHGLDGGRPATGPGAGSSGSAALPSPRGSEAGASGGAAAAVSAPIPKPTPTPTRSVVPPRSAPGGAPGPAAPTSVDAATLQSVLLRVGWRCGVLVTVANEPLASELIDKLAVGAAATNGYIGPPFGPGWIGTDPAGAARAFKARPLLVDANGGLWALRGDDPEATILQIVPEQARSGAVAWRSADVLWPVACPPAGTDAKSLILGRAAGDWPTGRITDLSVVRAQPNPTGGRQAT